MKNAGRLVLATLLISATSPLFAGGLWFEIGDPARAGDFATVRVFGVDHTVLTDPIFTGTAEGMVNHRRVSMPLTFAKLTEGSFYAIRWERPKEGTWALDIRLHEYSWPGNATRIGGLNLSADLFAVGASGITPEIKVFVPRPSGLSPAEVQRELRAAAAEPVASR